MKRRKRERALDPMDPSSYSDAPRGKKEERRRGEKRRGEKRREKRREEKKGYFLIS